MDLNIIKDYTIIICENKKQVLKMISDNHLFLHVKVFTKKDFFKEYFFNYDERSISYIINKYNIKIDIAKMYLDNLIYVDIDKDYKSDKLNYLVNLKKELINNNLLIFNNNFKSLLNKYNLLVLDYPYLEDYELEVFNKYNVKYININNNYKHDTAYEFNTIEDEIKYVANSICSLIDKGIDINKIKIMGIDEEYYNDLNRIFKSFNIRIKLDTYNTLYSNNIAKKFLKNNLSIEERIDLIKDDNKNIVNKIINVCNKYVYIDDINTKLELITNDFKNIKIDNYKYKNYIEIIPFNYIINDEYVYLMNFNMGCIPEFLKDEEYITDNIKNEVNLLSTKDINKLYKEYIIRRINNINNLIITYKLKTNNNIYYPSSLINDLYLNIVKVDNNISNYSLLDAKIELAKIYDNYYLYGNLSNNYYIYKNSSSDIYYKSYDNKYNGINKNINNIKLSYSSLDLYNKCAFRYYLTNILKLDKYEESFEAFIGSVFHDVLENCLNNNKDIDEEINNYLNKKNRVLNKKELFFINKIKEDLLFVINSIKEQNEYISLDKHYYEKYLEVKNNNYIFNGIIDKILYKEDKDNTLVSIIDYKTGNTPIDLRYVPYGLGMQLPIYLYLVKESNLFPNPRFVGFYLQNILDKDIKKDESSYIDKRKETLKLNGYSSSNISYLKEFDNTYKDSKLIKGIKLKKDGDFSFYSKVLNDNEIDKLINITKDVIENTAGSIKEAKFDINPKKIGYDDVVGCKYCKFSDICFKTNNDYVVLKEVNN